MIWRLSLWILLALVPTSPAVADKAAATWAWRTPISVAPGTPLQRVQLPAAALVSLREPGYADVRVLDADGRPQAIALLDPPRPGVVSRMTSLSPLPILGAPGALTVTGISLRVDREGASRVVRVDGRVASPSSAVLLGVLFDTEAASGRATVLTLEVDVPPQQPVTFQLDESTDLGAWRPVAESVVYRVPGRPARAILPLGANLSNQRYLRVTWRAATPLLAPVGVTGATLTTSIAAAPSPVLATLAGAALLDAHDLRATLPFATPVAAIRIVPADDGLVPVRILGRDDEARPWQLIGDGIAYRLGGNGGVKTGPSIPLSASFREIKVEADARTPGFTGVPTLELSFAPRYIASLLTGRAPFELVAGRPSAGAAFLPASALLASVGVDDPASLPLGMVRADQPVVRSTITSDDAGRRTWVLWTVLIAGTLALAVLAWVAARRPVPS